MTRVWYSVLDLVFDISIYTYIHTHTLEAFPIEAASIQHSHSFVTPAQFLSASLYHGSGQGLGQKWKSARPAEPAPQPAARTAAPVTQQPATPAAPTPPLPSPTGALAAWMCQAGFLGSMLHPIHPQTLKPSSNRKSRSPFGRFSSSASSGCCRGRCGATHNDREALD